MDIKYGINDAFTLDAIWFLISGNKFDDQILNLGPFEQQFNENRSFLLKVPTYSVKETIYSRRIGGRPNNQPTVAENETIIENPSSVDLINALKVSGRTKGGLGIGILNAVTKGHLQQLKTKTLRNKKRRGWTSGKLQCTCFRPALSQKFISFIYQHKCY
jgi:hypothetical protein